MFYLIKFSEAIAGFFTAAPSKLVPVIKIPLSPIFSRGSWSHILPGSASNWETYCHSGTSGRPHIGVEESKAGTVSVRTHLFLGRVYLKISFTSVPSVEEGKEDSSPHRALCPVCRTCISSNIWTHKVRLLRKHTRTREMEEAARPSETLLAFRDETGFVYAPYTLGFLGYTPPNKVNKQHFSLTRLTLRSGGGIRFYGNNLLSFVSNLTSPSSLTSHTLRNVRIYHPKTT